MKSHITIPKSTLKRFAKNQKVFYYDTKDRKITFTDVNDNKQEGYFSEDVEKFFSDKVETVLGRLCSDLKNFENRGEFVFRSDLKDKLIDIMAIQAMRNPDFFKKVMESNDDEAKDEFFKRIQSNLERIKETFENEYLIFFPSFSITPENSDYSFTLIDTHWYQFGDKAYIPISPRYAFMLIPLNEKTEKEFFAINSKGEQVTKFYILQEWHAVHIFKELIKHPIDSRLFASKKFLDKLESDGIIPHKT